MLHAVRTAALVFALAALPVGAQQGRNDSTFTWSKSLPANTMLTISNGNGPITVREAPAGSDRVEVRAVKNRRSRGSLLQDVAFDVRETANQVEIFARSDDLDEASCRDRGGSHNVRVSVEYTALSRDRFASSSAPAMVRSASSELAPTCRRRPATDVSPSGRRKAE